LNYSKLTRIFHLAECRKLIGVFLFITYTLGYSQLEKSNAAIINELLSRSFAPISEISFEGSNSVSIDVEENDYRKIAETNLIQLLTKKNLTTTLGNHFREYFVKATVNTIEISYPYIVASPLFGDKSFEREIRVNGNYFLKKDSLILLSKEFDETIKDTISSSQLDRIESTEYTFLKAELPEENFFRTLVEPVSIAVVSAAVIYLFFSVRSK